MLIRSTWSLSLSEVAVLPRSFGLELVKLLHEKLNLAMGGERVTSISCSGIIGSRSSGKEFFTFSTENFCSLSLCGLNATAAKAIASLELSPKLEFLGAKFNVINREDEVSSYEELYNNLVAIEPEPVRQFNLEFITPTAFAQGRINLPLPLPNLMFRSWLEKWNYFAPVYLGSDELTGYLSNAIMIKHHRINTRSFHLPRGYIQGFMGEVKLLTLPNTDPLLANVANLLISYGRWAGTGVKTRLGMGQTNLIS